MADATNGNAYIGIEREENSLRYVAKVLGGEKHEITKTQYNAIVKALGKQDWKNSDENEASIINRIIDESLKLQNDKIKAESEHASSERRAGKLPPKEISSKIERHTGNAPRWSRRPKT